MAELRIKVDRVLYPPEGVEGDWHIIATDKGPVKGKISWRPNKNEMLLLEGNYSTYQGRPEFKFTSARADVPIDARDQLRYVCEVTPGFGFAMESKIWEAWGEDWKEKAEPGIIKLLKGKKFDALLNSIDNLKLKRDESDAVAWMMSIGASVNMAQAAWDRWGKEAIGIVKSDCYRLAELPNYGFSHVDRSIRHTFNITDTDPRRIKAGVMYSIKQLTESGSTLVNWFILKDSIFHNLGQMSLAAVNECVRQMFAEQTLIPFERNKDVAIAKDYDNATIIWSYVNADSTGIEKGKA